MPKYRVYLVTTASTVVEVEVEASEGDEAVEVALGGDLPYAPAFADYEFGEWTTASELFPKWSTPEGDYELIGEDDD